jgi:hypothetical protein
LGDKNIKKLKQTRSIATQLCSDCQVNTHLFLVKHLGIFSLQYSSDHYFRPIPLDSSLFPYHIHPYHFFSKHFVPRPPLFSSPILMAHTRSQDLEARFNTLQSGLLETQQEVKQISANVAPSIQPYSPQWAKSKKTSPPSLNQSFRHSAPNCISLQITLPLPHPHILKMTIPLIPIPCRTITFNVTYAFHGWM